MLDLKNFSVNNQVSLNALLTTREALRKRRLSLIDECKKYQSPFDKSYLQNPEYIKISETINADQETITHISNCVQLYLKYGNITGIQVVDDRKEVRNVLVFDVAPPKSFNKAIHKLGFKIIGNRVHKTSLFKGVDEYENEHFFSISGHTKHNQVEARFYELSKSMYVLASHYSVNCFKRDGYRVVYGYVNENNEFFETGYIA